MTAQIAARPDAESGSTLISPQRRSFVFLDGRDRFLPLAAIWLAGPVGLASQIVTSSPKRITERFGERLDQGTTAPRSEEGEARCQKAKRRQQVSVKARGQKAKRVIR